jgi:methylaspartate mutase epsilon subunit
VNHARRHAAVAGSSAAPFGSYVERMQAAGLLVVQPRMGMSSPARMRAGLLATKHADGATAGTITLDSYTRVGDHAAAKIALSDKVALNGYPIVAHGVRVSREVLEGIRDEHFPVQVRHGSASPGEIFVTMAMIGLDASEGGPVSYCLPYSRMPLRESVRHWSDSCTRFSRLAELGASPHLETFGGCMMGQLCPPSLLIAISVLEAMFFCNCGLRSVSLSYAQQTSAEQDLEAIQALRRLAAELLPGVQWHIVLYAYMGVYPSSRIGADRLLADASQLAVQAGAARLIVKTAAEAHRIPTVAENVAALEQAARTAITATVLPPVPETGLYAEARAIVEAVLDLHPDLGRALVGAFERGYLDVPYCLHPDNLGRTRSVIDDAGWLRWSSTGNLPVPAVDQRRDAGELTSSGLLAALSYLARRYDGDEPAFAAPQQTQPLPDEATAFGRSVEPSEMEHAR